MAKRNKKKRYINPIGLLLLSLVLHLAFLFFTAQQSLWNHLSSTFPTPSQDKKFADAENKLLPAKLSPRKSDFGVMFISEESSPPPQQQIPPSKSIQTEAQEPAPAPSELLEKQITTATPPPPLSTVIEAPSPIIATIEEKPQKTTLAKQEEEQPSHKQVAHSSTTALSNRIEKILQQNTNPSQEVPKVDYQTQTPPKKKTLLAMTKGFIENLKDKGTDWLEQDGVKRALTQEELKYISYEEQVNWALQASWKRYCAHQISVTGNVLVTFLLNAKGNVIETKLIQSSGNETLDNMVVKSIQQASPFPPLPKFFDKQEYQVSRNIRVG